MNVFEFANDVVYCSPMRRTIETLCNVLATHPQKSRLTVRLVPWAKEVLFGYGNVPVLLGDLKAEMTEKVVRQFGFKDIDFSALEDDNLWYIRSLELRDPALKERYLALV